MRTITFNDGHRITTELTVKETLKRMRRLDVLRVLTEGYEYGEGASICKKARKAYDKEDNFTGIIRLTLSEKDFLGYLLEDSMLSTEEIDALSFYIRYRR